MLKIDNINLGLNITEDFTMAMAVATKSADAAKEIAEELKNGLEQVKGILALIAGQQKEVAPLVDIIGSMKVATDSNTVTLKSEVSHELIEKSLKK